MAGHDLIEIRTSSESVAGLTAHPIHRAVCACEWVGGWRNYVSEAEADHAHHVVEMREVDDGRQ